MKTIFVTFSIERMQKDFTTECKKYAIKCQNDKEAKACASDLYSMDGINYIRINRCNRINRNAQVFDFENYNKPYKF